PEFAGRYYIEEFTPAFRYMDYQLPRILYQLKDTSGQETSFSFEKEGPAQTQRSQYYMGGLIWRFGPGGTTPGFSAFFDAGLYAGSGPADYLLYQYDASGNQLKTMDGFTASVFVADVALGGGLRFRLTPRKSRF